MTVLRRIIISTLAVIFFSETAQAGLHGHSGLVLHVDKYGHLSGHSTHYDYRFYPEKSLWDPLPLIENHHSIMSHHHDFDDDDHHEAFRLIDDEDYHHGSQPYYYVIHHKGHHYDHHSYHHSHH